MASAVAFFGAALLSVLAGSGMAVQATVNTRCGTALGVSTLGVLATFAVAVPLLTVVCYIESRVLKLGFLTWREPPRWYHLIPGAMGTCYVMCGALVTRALGSALFFVPLIVGQLAQSALMDHLGLSTADGSRKVMTPGKVAALALARCGAGLSVLEKLSGSGGGGGELSAAAQAGYLLSAFAVGTLTPAQAALSRSVIPRVPSRLQATWWTFSVGGLCTAVIVGAQLAADPAAAEAMPRLAPEVQWWMFTGGLFGIAYIASSIFFAPAIGSASYFVALVSGQLAGSALIDSWGAFLSPVRAVTPLHAAGVVMVLAASAMLAAISHAQTAVAQGAAVEEGGGEGGGGEGGKGGAETLREGLLGAVSGDSVGAVDAVAA